MIWEGVSRDVALDDDAVDDGRSLLRAPGQQSRRSPQQEGDGGTDETKTLHQHGVRSGAPAPIGAGVGGVRPGSRSGP